MALNKTNLKSDLQSLFSSPPSTISACADAWAAAYASYAAGALSCQGSSPVLTGRESALSSALQSVFASSTNPATTAAAFDAALTAFWTAVAFPPGVTPGVAAPPAPGLLTSGLPTMWASNVASAASYSDAAQAHADLFDIVTKTVVVTHAAPSVCAAPIF